MGEKTNREKWFEIIGKEAENECLRLLGLVEEMRKNGAEIYPSQQNIFRAIDSISPESVRSVILGQDPYHEPNQAMGLAFSVPEGERIPPSLRNIFRELNADTGAKIPQSGDLSTWTERGVLLLNTALTVEAHRANSHKKLGWQRVTDAIVRACAGLEQPVAFLCWGNPAIELAGAALKKYGRGRKLQICSTHPSPLSANNTRSQYPAFIGSRPFGKVNGFFAECGEPPVDWRLND